MSPGRFAFNPKSAPTCAEIRVRLDLPSYLRYPPQEQRIQDGALNFLPGTTAVFTGEAVRNLSSATLQGSESAPLAIDGPSFKTAPILLELERDVTFTWRDTLGLDGPGPMTIHATPRDDEPPEVELRGLEAAIAILPEETVPIDLDSTDDYGVQRLTLAWQSASPSPMAPPGSLHEIKLADGRPQARTLAGHYDFNPALLKIPSDTTIIVHGLAIDYYPDRQPASTSIYRIHVLSREAHARLVHDQFEKLLEQFDELTRRQAAILQSGKTLRSESLKQLDGDESTRNLAQQSGDQQQTADRLDNLAHQMAGTLAEALRNSQISPETLRSLASHAEEMQRLAASAMPAAAQSLHSAQADSAQRPEKLDQAIRQEQDILNTMRQMAQQAGHDLESIMAQTLAARLRRAAGAERNLAASFRQMLPETIGMTPTQLPTEPRKKLDLLGASHAEVTREVVRIEDEISRLFDRTALNRYGDVAREMDGLKTQDSLAALSKLVLRNIGVQSIDTAGHWGDQFETWAARLGEKDDSHTAENAAAGEPDPAQMQALITLMRLRQQQDQLREQASVIDERKETSPDYQGDAKAAAQAQGGLRDQVQSLAQNPSFPLPPRQLAQIGKSMDDATRILGKPETGKPAYDAQTDAINLLDAAIAQQAQKSGQNAAVLMVMMGMGGIGNAAGGSSSKPNVPIPGSREGEAPDQRSVLQAGGLDNSQLPGEFRNAIESYHRAIEQSSP